MKENLNLCQCNNCGSIMVDENPQIGAKQFNIDLMMNPKILRMEFIQEPTDGGDEEYFWGCPICETDANLSDELNDEQIKLLTI